MREGRESWAADFAFAERFPWDTQAGNPHTWQAEEVLGRAAKRRDIGHNTQAPFKIRHRTPKSHRTPCQHHENV